MVEAMRLQEHIFTGKTQIRALHEIVLITRVFQDIAQTDVLREEAGDRGGGVAFGPTPRSYAYRLNRKVRRLALRSVLSEKVQENNMVVVDALKFDAIKTKDFVKVMDAFKFDGKTLFVADIAEDFENAFLSMRNIPNAALLTVEELNVYDIANAQKLVMTEAAANKAGEVFA